MTLLDDTIHQPDLLLLARVVARRRAQRGRGHIDISELKRDQVAELWEFARFETDRAHRNIDHLRSGSSHLKGPTARHLTKRYKLEARFYEFLAGQLETIIPPEELIELLDET